MAARILLLVASLLAATSLVVGSSELGLTPQELSEGVDLGESEGSLLSSFDDEPDMSLGEIQQVAVGVQTLNQQGAAKLRAKFSRLAYALNSPQLRESALEMSQMVGTFGSVHGDLAETNSTEGGSAGRDTGGMKLVHKKLDELRLKTLNEGTEDHKNNQMEQANCAKTQAGAAKMIESASKATARNNAQMKSDAMEINNLRADTGSLESSIADVHQEFIRIHPERAAAIAQAMERIDERAKALDVLSKAIYIVCEKFKRFSNSAQCRLMKSMPDVEEPALDKQRGNSTLVQDQRSTKEFEKEEADNFNKMAEADEAKEGNPNPEGLPSEEDPVGMHAAQQRGGSGAPLNEMAKLAREPLSAQVSTPLIELVVAIRKGHRKKVINIVQVLIDVKHTIYEEQIADKKNHVKELDQFYDKSWQLQSIMAKQLGQSTNVASRTEECRVRIQELMADNENQRKMLNNQKAIKLSEEDRCAKLTSEFGMRESTRKEDLENLLKLKSLLRSLYNKELPTACKQGPLVKQVCSGQDAGWCVFEDLSGPNQRCSCNYGFHGELCEYKMCPGLGHIKFRSDAAGVCSDRGTCNHLTGVCDHCDDGFYHGEKEACEYKKCPLSIGPDGEQVEDEKCSGHGTCDKVRGVCNCEYEWSGESCASKKCPNSNSVLYPMESANACNGRGACNDKTGTCSCKAPYSGVSCEKKACPRECSKNGGCDEFTGKCFCKKPHIGSSCALMSCPDDCNDGGWCDVNTGKCLCKKGFSGETCRRSTRCTSEAHSDSQANWYTQWDKPGWIICPPGQAIYALYRGECDALSCLDSGKCAAPCEGEGDSATVIGVRHCYHSTQTYKDFDEEGWSKCDPNYYVAGLYRSCDSLYCLNMFKCCSFRLKETPTREVLCEDISIPSFDNAGWMELPSDKFVSGFYRGKGHTLSNIDKVRSCGWTRGY